MIVFEFQKLSIIFIKFLWDLFYFNEFITFSSTRNPFPFSFYSFSLFSPFSLPPGPPAFPCPCPALSLPTGPAFSLSLSLSLLFLGQNWSAQPNRGLFTPPLTAGPAHHPLPSVESGSDSTAHRTLFSPGNPCGAGLVPTLPFFSPGNPASHPCPTHTHRLFARPHASREHALCCH